MFISWLTHAYNVVYQQYKSSHIIHSFIIIFIQQKLPVNMCLEILYWTAECKLAGHAFFSPFILFWRKTSYMFLQELLCVVSFTNGDKQITCYIQNNAVACTLWVHRPALTTMSERIILLWVGAKNIHHNQLRQNKDQPYSAGSCTISLKRTPLFYMTHWH